MICTNILCNDSNSVDITTSHNFPLCEKCTHSPHSWGESPKITSINGMSKRLRNALARGGIENVAELLLATSTQLHAISNLGAVCYSELTRYLASIVEEGSWSRLELEEFGFSEKHKKQQEVEKKINTYFTALCNYNLLACEGILDERNADDRIISVLSIVDIVDNYLDAITNKEERNVQIFRHRIGLGDIEINTLQAIGEQNNITRERVRQIYSKVFQKVTRKRQEYEECKRALFAQIEQYSLFEFYCLVFDDLLELTNRYFIILLFKLLFEHLDITQFENQWKTYCDLCSKRKITDKRNVQLAAKLQRVVIFPGEMRKYNASVCNTLPKRNVSDHQENESGTVILQKSSRPLQYESRMERRILEFLDRNPWVKEINAQCVEIPYTYNGNTHKYYPDIVFKTKDDAICLLECKPIIRMAVYRNIVKYRALHQYCRTYGFGYTVIDSGCRSIIDLLGMEYNKEFADILEDECRKVEYLTWPDVLRLAENMHIRVNAKELSAIIIKKHLQLGIQPFSLRI